jgi:hypothetical protein
MINKKLTDKRIAELLDRAEVCDDSVLTDYADIAAAMRELQDRRKVDIGSEPVAYKVADVLLDNLVQAKAFKADTNLDVIPLYTIPQPVPINIEMVTLFDELLENGDFFISAIESNNYEFDFEEWKSRAEKLLNQVKSK